MSPQASDDFVREVNENIAQLGVRFGLQEGVLELICECGDPGCAERVEVPLADYELLHAADRRIVAPGHARGHAAELHPSYAVVDD